jgi:glutathione-specific gamma-glutamylcyclotransferase
MHAYSGPFHFQCPSLQPCQQEGQQLDNTLWVFGYGSLIWNPGFAYQRAEVARLSGWHRSFCMASVHYRGTIEAPGLVLALDRIDDGYCDGVAYAIDPTDKDATLTYLRDRELISYAYLEDWLDVDLSSGTKVRALSYVINRDHSQYRGGLTLEQQAQIIAKSNGERGPNCDYLYATTDHLAKLGIADIDLAWLSARVRELRNLSGN